MFCYNYLRRVEYFGTNGTAMQDIIKEDTKQKTEQNAKILISWSSAEYETSTHRRSIAWYWASLIIAALLTMFALWQNNVLFAVFVIVAWLLVVSLSGSAPKKWTFAISEDGITIGENKQYDWSEIVGFDIHEESDTHKALLIKTTQTLTPITRINIPKSKERAIVDILAKFVKREEYEESLIDALMKIMRF